MNSQNNDLSQALPLRVGGKENMVPLAILFIVSPRFFRASPLQLFFAFFAFCCWGLGSNAGKCLFFLKRPSAIQSAENSRLAMKNETLNRMHKENKQGLKNLEVDI